MHHFQVKYIIIFITPKPKPNMFLAGLFFGTYDGFKNLFPNASNKSAPLVHLCAGIFAEVVHNHLFY